MVLSRKSLSYLIFILAGSMSFGQARIKSIDYFPNSIKIIIENPTLGAEQFLNEYSSVKEKSSVEFIQQHIKLVIPFPSKILPQIDVKAISEYEIIASDIIINELSNNDLAIMLNNIKNVKSSEKIISKGTDSFVEIGLTKFMYDRVRKHVKYVTTYEIDIKCPISFKYFFEKNLIINQSVSELNGKVIKENDVVIKVKSDDSWINYNYPHVKIGVNSDGVYRLTGEQLSKAGINIATILPNRIQMFAKGIEQQIYVSGSEDNKFDPNDYIEFISEANVNSNYREVSKYGEPYKEFFNRYTDTTVYWLTWNLKEGKRAQLNINMHASSDTVDYYSHVVRYENNSWFDFSMEDQVRRELPFWFENKTWVEAQLGVGTKNVNLSISDLYPNRKAFLFAKLMDFASDIHKKPHLLAISINSDKIIRDSTYLDKYQHIVLSNSINSNLLTNGTNTLKIYSFKTDATLNSCATDWYEIEYPRYIKPLKDTLVMKFPFINKTNRYVLKISGLTNQNYIVWKKDANYSRQSFTSTKSTFNLVDSLSNNSKVLVFSEAKVKSPFIYSFKNFENLHSTGNSADYVIITHKNFLKKAGEYAKFIEQQYNVKTKVVDVHEIYNEFSYGIFNPEAIRDFLHYAYKNWKQPSYKYVLLIGGATYDYFGNKNKFQGAPIIKNYVPSFGASVSDTWFVTWDTTSFAVPWVSIGRLPVTSEDELDNYLQKHKNYVTKPFSFWNKRYIFFSGGAGNNQGQIDALRNVNSYIIDNMVLPAPVGGKFFHFYKTINPSTNYGPVTTTQFKEVIDSGAVFISYLGHSGTQTWDNSITDPGQLKSSIGRSPLISDFGCSTARFAEPDIISFAQLFVTDKKGDAIAYIGNSSSGYTSTSYTFPKLFYHRIFSDSSYSIGDAHRLAKLDLITNFGNGQINQLFGYCNTLIGDPIIKLPIPPKSNLYINNSLIKLEKEVITNNDDSTTVDIKFYNLGKVINDSIDIKIDLISARGTEWATARKKKLPSYDDEFKINIPVKGKSGSYKLIFKLDANNKINELNEADNSAELGIDIIASNIRLVENISPFHQIKNPVELLNPVAKENFENSILQLSDNQNFNSPRNYSIKFDTVITKLKLDNSVNEKRYWMKIFSEKDPTSSNPISVLIGDRSSEIFQDKHSYSTSQLKNIVAGENGLTLNNRTVTISALSAGFNDGNTALIQLNGSNLIPENTLRGHHIILFDEQTLDFVKYLRIDVMGGGTASQDYIKFLDTVSTKYIIAFAISDEGRVTASDLIAKLKDFGSKYIEKVGFRGSWAMIGKKHGKIGEAYSTQYKGRVSVDTTLTRVETIGSLTTDKIGPVAMWEDIAVRDSLAGKSKINYQAVLIDRNLQSKDTVGLSLQNSKLDLSTIDAKKYPYLKIESSFYSDEAANSPFLKKIAVNYKRLPELAINYQVVWVNKDTLEQGENSNLTFSIYNVGEVTAAKFKFRIELVRKDNSREKLYEQLIDSIGANSKKNIKFTYNTATAVGVFKYVISIDSENDIFELYEDNNSFSIPFTVKPNTKPASLRLTFDGNDIMNGDYVSSKPNIKIDLTDESLIPITDTTHIQMLLNNKRIYFKQNPNVNYSVSSSNPKFVVEYKPLLSDGDNIFKVIGRKATGELIDSIGTERKFVVKNELKLLEVYNYPNPFKDDTYFTFKLTQIPDEMKIKIFSIAGRMLKEIKLSSGDLKYDFNRIYWDGRDEDGDLLANGVYLYRIITHKGSETIDTTEKLAIVR